MPTPPLPDEVLLEAVEAMAKYGKKHLAYKALGIPGNTFENRLKLAKLRGIGTINEQLNTLHGHNPTCGMTHVVPAPLIVRGTSTNYNKDGEITQQWVKTKLDDRLVEVAMKAAIEALSDSVERVAPSPTPNHTSEHLCNLYTFTDCHVGMKSWGAETGADWDLEIAERTLKGAFDYLVKASPPAKTCIVLNLGDFLHFDSLSAVTPTNGHLLDADSRYSKVVKVAITILRYIVNQALAKHEVVKVIMSEGNHDPASSVWLRHLFAILYENEPRVQVLESEMVYTVHQHGQTMLAFHHGHMSKKESLPLLFAAQFSKEWGATTKRYCHVGHYHHVDEKEHSGMTVKQHATLSARDAYAARGGWIADRKIEAITYHSEYGQVGTITCTTEMLS